MQVNEIVNRANKGAFTQLVNNMEKLAISVRLTTLPMKM
jgi:hypothetical protein